MTKAPLRKTRHETMHAARAVADTPLPERLRALRELLGYSEQDVATGIGIAQPTYHLVEIGVTALSLARLSELADFYELPIVLLASGYQLTPSEERTVRAGKMLRTSRTAVLTD